LLPYLLLPIAGVLGGALNAAAGGGSFIVFPALVFAGILPREANETTTVALWIASWATLGGYRKALQGMTRTAVPMAIASFAGGLGGAVLLLETSPLTFQKILPFLLLAATILFAFGPLITKRLPKGSTAGPVTLVLGCVAQLLTSTYGGYFGGGMGVLMLATFALMGMTDLARMNALKVVLTLFINGVATATFVARGGVDWRAAAAVAVGGVLGGFFGARLTMKIDARYLRVFIIVVSCALTVHFFLRRG
jgi:hypothetical protein